MAKEEKALIIGAGGQVGIELTRALALKLGGHNVVASDLRPIKLALPEHVVFETLDALDADKLSRLVSEYNITSVYHLAAMLSATAEKHPLLGWDLNMKSLFNVLELAKAGKIEKIFWPSSIAVFGPSTPADQTPQHTLTQPTTVYGISKSAGEQWCEYYFKNFGVDVRSVRYPGLIGYNSLPGGGTTDYAVNIFYDALEKGTYTCFLEEETTLPMMLMEDAINATIGIMEAPATEIKVRSSYNISGMSFNPRELSFEIQKVLPNFKIDYKPDYRQKVAASWPRSIDDQVAKQDWNWNTTTDLKALVTAMLEGISRNKQIEKETI